MDLTEGQRTVVHFLYTMGAHKTEEISSHLNSESGLNDWSYDRVHSILKRLEKRGIVWRNKAPAYWRLTTTARGAYFSKKTGIR